MTKMNAFSLKYSFLLLLVTTLAWGQEPPEAPPAEGVRAQAAAAPAPVARGNYVEPGSANEVWSDMTEAGVNQHNRRTYVRGAAGAPVAEGLAADAGTYVMYGGEKEGSSALISRVMGPKADAMKFWVEQLTPDNRKAFLVDFLTGFANGKYRVRDVKNAEGVIQAFDLNGLRGQNYAAMDDAALTEKFHLFVERGGDKSLSFITPGTRMKMMNGTLPGLTKATGALEVINFGYFEALFGDAEKYIDAAHGTSVGWEINFIPQRSYGEFEHMIDWFKVSLKNAGKLFEAPGHQWIVYPKTKAMMESPEVAARVVDKVNEVHKNNQAYIVLRAIEGDAGIQYSHHKSVHAQSVFGGNNHSTGRGVIRLEDNRFRVDSADALAVEFRAGTKSDPVRRNTQRFLISRYAAQEFDDIAQASSWTLNHPVAWGGYTAEEIVRRFHVTPEEAEKFLANISEGGVQRRGATRALNQSFLVPLWNWGDAPYLSKAKKVELEGLTQAFIKTVARLQRPNANTIGEAMKSWAKVSRLSSDIENYLRPKPRLANPESAAGRIALADNARVNINNVDVGIEYTARYPLKTSAEFTDIPGQKGKVEWLRTSYEYSKDERRQILRRAAQAIAKEQNNNLFTKVNLVAGGDGHGHGLDVAYEFRDSKDRKWRVEWDGIGRSYDTAGNMIPESLRGGHIEIVTPKYNPTEKEMAGVFRALERESLIPSPRFGGGHVNVDLAPFEGKPKALARFLGSYYDNRNMMTLMFQHPGRGVGAEPNRASPQLIERLKNFNGTEQELKELLYNERFFNTRVGRKTKNNQLNMIAYFQDAIPERFIHEDFDMKNDMWRRTFDVNPNIRKMEFRMFNAPRNAAESALQIKFVRAMMNQALNEDVPVFRGNYDVNIERLTAAPDRTITQFDTMMRELHLDPAEFRPFLTEGMALTQAHMNSPLALSNDEKLALHPEVRDWGTAERRTTAIGSEGRRWAGNDILPEAREWKQAQLVGRQAGERARRIPAVEGRVSKLTLTGGDSIVSGSRCRTAETVVADLLRE